MWDCTGLECVIPYTNPAHDELIAVLSDKPLKNTIDKTLWAMTMRARYNSQRHYEIYFVDAVDGITEDDIRDMFTASPQTAADTIRELGQVFYSDRVEERPVIV